MPIDDPTLELMAAITAALKVGGNPVAGRVYNPVPAGAAFPYISLGTIQLIGENVECLEGAEVFVTIDGWSRAGSKAEIGAVGKWIIAKLDDADLSGADLAVNSCTLDSCQYLEDPDGKTSHFSATFHILTD